MRRCAIAGLASIPGKKRIQEIDVHSPNPHVAPRPIESLAPRSHPLKPYARVRLLVDRGVDEMENGAQGRPRAVCPQHRNARASRTASPFKSSRLR